MATTSNVSKWLAQIDLDEEVHENIYSLYSAIRSSHDYGRFKYAKDPVTGGKLITPHTGEDTLLLVNDNAEAYFLNLLTQKYCGDLDIESWHSLNQSLAKAD